MSLGATPNTWECAHTRLVRYRRKFPARIPSVLAHLVLEIAHPPLDSGKAEPWGRRGAGPSRPSAHSLRGAAWVKSVDRGPKNTRKPEEVHR